MLYIGGETFIKNKEIIGIFDLDGATVCKNSREFLETAEENKKIVYTSIYDLPLSFVLTRDKTYISPIAAKTLKRRLEKGLIG